MKMEYNEENFKELFERLSYLREEVKKYKYDSLTGLRQRRDFDDTLNRRFEACEFEEIPFAFIFADAIGLHNLNRSPDGGYEAGNQLLISIGKRLKERFEPLGKADVFRISGDEFGVMLTGCDENNLKDMDLDCDMMSIVYVTVKPGSCFPTPSSVFKAADKLMIAAKNSLPKEDRS